MSEIVTFVIPSVGRKTLLTSIASLQKQRSYKWKAIVGFDGIKREELIFDLPQDQRIRYTFLEKTGELKSEQMKHSKAGQVRNQIIEHVDTEWTAFLDDDDTLDSEYVSILEKKSSEEKEKNCFIFQMKAANGDVIPFTGSKQIRIGQVGISFCVKTNFLKQNNILFKNSQSEDYEMLKNIASNGGKIRLIEHIGYIVGR